jgi:hypothetical protein
MKCPALILAALICAPFPLFAAPPTPSVPPPPDINDKGVATSAKAVDLPGPAPGTIAPESESVKPAMPDTRPVRDRASRSKDRTAAEIAASSDSVTERKEGNDTVEEYREKGKLRMVRIVPANGPSQTYFDRNGDGRLDRDPMDGPVAPVYFTIYEWN